MSDTKQFWSTNTENYAEEVDRYGGLVETGIPIFESEDLTSKLLEIFLSMMASGWQAISPAIPMPIEGVGGFYLDGLWLPCVKRYALEAQIDFANDGLVDSGSVPLQVGSRFDFIYSRKTTAPRGWCSPGPSRATYLIGRFDKQRAKSGTTDFVTRAVGADSMVWEGWYYSIIGDRLTPMKSPLIGWPSGGVAGELARYGAGALQTVSDFRHLWVVRTTEDVVGSIKDTPIRLGVTPEMVASLFYARSLPVTSSGRRRPILHWVRAHQRRLKEGVEIDVAKHLRGITSFEMDGFEFDITQPVRTHVKAA